MDDRASSVGASASEGHLMARAFSKDELWAIFRGCLFIGFLSLILALAVNALRPSPLPLISRFVFGPSAPEVDPAAAQEWASKGEAFFIDSRSYRQFRRGHLTGAKSLPVKDFSALFPVMSPLLPVEGWIVIYGEGRGRPTERELAFLFLEAGKVNVRILQGGFRAWEKRGYPVTKK